MPKATAIPEDVANQAIRRLRDALRKDGRSDLASSLLIEAKRGYLYVAEAKGSPVCRLRYAEKTDDWELQIFKWSSESYDAGNDFMFGGGTLEECITAAIDGYNL